MDRRQSAVREGKMVAKLCPLLLLDRSIGDLITELDNEHGSGTHTGWVGSGWIESGGVRIFPYLVGRSGRVQFCGSVCVTWMIQILRCM